jgi:hypothetical protein
MNPSAQSCVPRFFLGILIFKGLIAQRLYKSFGVKGLMSASRLPNLSPENTQVTKLKGNTKHERHLTKVLDRREQAVKATSKSTFLQFVYGADTSLVDIWQVVGT